MIALLFLLGGCRLQEAVAHRDDGGDQVSLELNTNSFIKQSHRQPATQERLASPNETSRVHEEKQPASPNEPSTSQRDLKSHQTSGKPDKKKQATATPLVCPCLEEDELPLPRDIEGSVLIPASFFRLNSDEVYKRDRAWGTYCAAHDEDLAPDCDKAGQPGEKLGKAKDHCSRRWCFVADGCACGEAATKLNGKMYLKDAWHIPMSRLKTDYFNAQEGRETNIWYSYANCGEGTDWVDEHMSSHNQSFCGTSSASGHCDQESEVCYRDAHGAARYAGSQATPGSTSAPWISVGLGFGAFVLMVLIGWLVEGLKYKPPSPESAQPLSPESAQPSRPT